MNKTNISDLALNAFYYISAYFSETISLNNKIKLDPSNDYLLIYTLNGQGIFKHDNIVYQLQQQTILFYPCTSINELSLTALVDWNIHVLLLNGSQIASYYDLYLKNHANVSNLSSVSHIPYLIDALLINCASDMTPQHLIELENSKLITNLLTDLILEKDEPERHAVNIPTYLIKVKEYLENNYSEKITLAQLAKYTQTNKYQLAHDFKQYYSISPITYLINVRLSIAKELLINTSSRVTTISLDIGFNNTNHFINLFKKETGLTPLQYRKTYGKQNIL